MALVHFFYSLVAYFVVGGCLSQIFLRVGVLNSEFSLGYCLAVVGIVRQGRVSGRNNRFVIP